MEMHTLFLLILFLAVAFLSLLAWPLLVGFIAIGLIICATVKFKGQSYSSYLFRSGLVLMVSPITTFLVVSLLMKGGL